MQTIFRNFEVHTYSKFQSSPKLCLEEEGLQYIGGFMAMKLGKI